MFQFVRKNAIFILLLCLFSMHAARYIYKKSFVVEGERYFALIDDTMISMRYAKNFAQGYGLVWNVGGPRVEGYTNPLYVLYMSFFHLLPISPSKISLSMQITCVLFLLLNLIVVKKIASRIFDESSSVSLGAVALTGFYASLNFWGFYGVEVAPLAFLVSLCALITINCMRSDKSCVSVFLVAGIGTLIRPDFITFFLAILIFLMIADPKHRKANLWAGLLIFIIFVVSQTIFRIIYFGDPLPNTYYLKMTGYPIHLRITRGIYVFLNFLIKSDLILMIAPFFILFFKRDKKILLIFWLIISQVAYSIYVGGDAWEKDIICNRFISIVMPLFLVLLSYVLYNVSKRIVEELNNRGFLKNKFGKTACEALFAFLIIAGILNLNNPMLNNFFLYHENSQESVYCSLVERALLLEKVTTPYAKIATTEAGVTPYFCNRYFIDLLGKTDKYIAKQKAKTTPGLGRFIYFLPGHMKYDTRYSIEELKPDVIIKIWLEEDKKETYLEKDYVKVYLKKSSFSFIWYLRKDSKNILWEQVKKYK